MTMSGSLTSWAQSSDLGPSSSSMPFRPFVNDPKASSYPPSFVSPPGSTSMKSNSSPGVQRSMIEFLLSELGNTMFTKKKEALDTFEKYYFNAKPRLEREEFIRLLLGESQGKGLLAAAGYTNTLSLNKTLRRSAAQAIGLLARMLDNQTGHDAMNLQSIFLDLDMTHYRQMRLDRHIMNNCEGAHIIAARYIISILQERYGRTFTENLINPSERSWSSIEDTRPTLRRISSQPTRNSLIIQQQNKFTPMKTIQSQLQPKASSGPNTTITRQPPMNATGNNNPPMMNGSVTNNSQSSQRPTYLANSYSNDVLTMPSFSASTTASSLSAPPLPPPMSSISSMSTMNSSMAPPNAASILPSTMSNMSTQSAAVSSAVPVLPRYIPAGAIPLPGVALPYSSTVRANSLNSANPLNPPLTRTITAPQPLRGNIADLQQRRPSVSLTNSTISPPSTPSRGSSTGSNSDRFSSSTSSLSPSNSNSSSVSNSGNTSSLPSPWQRFFDSQSNHYYYYNPDTGETTWNRPSLTSTNSLEIASQLSTMFENSKQSTKDNNNNKNRFSLPTTQTMDESDLNKFMALSNTNLLQRRNTSPTTTTNKPQPRSILKKSGSTTQRANISFAPVALKRSVTFGEVRHSLPQDLDDGRSDITDYDDY